MDGPQEGLCSDVAFAVDGRLGGIELAFVNVHHSKDVLRATLRRDVLLEVVLHILVRLLADADVRVR